MKTSGERPWRWRVWHAADDEWHAELTRRHAEAEAEAMLAVKEAVNVKRAAEEPHTPKRIHQIWLGPHKLPPRCIQWMESWQAHHPDWSYRLWRDNDVDEFKLKNEKAYREACNYGEKSDILRYEILNRLGGVYVDVDMECLQPFDALVTRYAFAAGISNTGCVEINNAVVVAAPGHPILKRLIDKIYTEANRPLLNTSMLERIALLGGADISQHLNLQRPSAAATPMSTIERTGPGLMTRTFMEAIGWKGKSLVVHEGFMSAEDQQTVVALPVEVLYPLANNAPQQTELPSPYPPQSLAVHYWQRSWMTSSPSH